MKARSVLAFIGLVLLLFMSDPALAAKRSVRVLDVSPQSVAAPVTSTSGSALNVCVSGFDEGDVLVFSVPWVGSPNSHTELLYSYTINASGGICFVCPPNWTELDLQPGSYTITTRWSNGNGSITRRGPTGTFSVSAP